MDTTSNDQTPPNPLKAPSGDSGCALPVPVPLFRRSGRPTKPAPCPSESVNRQKVEDKICWEAKDGQVCIVIKSWPRRWPQSSYPVMVVRLRAKQNTRIQGLEDGPGVEALLTFQELEQVVEVTNRIGIDTGKGKIFEILQRIPPKDPARKEKWKRINAAYHRRKRRGEDGRRP